MSAREDSIIAWAENTFGPVHDLKALTSRLRLELDELEQALDAGENEGVAHETADIAILLMRICYLGGDRHLSTAVDEKMAINRARRWRRTGDGTGRHVKTEGGT